MTRSRTLIAAASALAAAGLLAGCGGGSDSGSSSTTPAPATGTTASSGAPSGATGASALSPIGTLSPASDTAGRPSLDGYGRFGKVRDIFKDPTVAKKKAKGGSGAAAASGPVALPGGVPVSGPSTSTGTPSGAGTSAGTQGAPAAAVAYEAVLDLSGQRLTVAKGDQLPKESKQLTVSAITKTAVSLRLNTGQLPGGSNVIVVKVGEAITLTNRDTNEQYEIRVLLIRQAGSAGGGTTSPTAASGGTGSASSGTGSTGTTPAAPGDKGDLDSAAKSLLSKAASAMETYFADAQTYEGALGTKGVSAIDPTIVFQSGPASAAQKQVQVTNLSVNTYTLATVSASGSTFTYKKNADGTTTGP